MNKTTYLVKKVLFLLVLVTMFFALTLHVFASDFKIEKFNQSETEKLLKNLQITPITELPQGHHISNFDVNEKGEIAMSFNDINTVAVINCNGEFLYGYKLKTHGSIYAEMGNGHVNIICVRGSDIVSIDNNGNILSAGKLKYNANYPTALTQTTHKVGNETFRLSNHGTRVLGMISGRYSKIERCNTLNNEINVIYDVGNGAILKIIFVMLGVVVFFASLFAIVCFKFYNKRRNKK